MLLPFNPNIKVQQTQREQLIVIGFLTNLPSDYYSTKSQILLSTETSSFEETRHLVQQNSSCMHPPTQLSSALAGRHIVEPEKNQYRNVGPRGDTKELSSGGVI